MELDLRPCQRYAGNARELIHTVFSLHEIQWLFSQGPLHILLEDHYMPAGNAPVFSGTVDLTPDILNAAKKAGPNAQGNYSFRVALWNNDKRDKDTAPHFKGQVTVNKMENSPKAYSSFWQNGESVGSSFASSSSNDDLF